MVKSENQLGHITQGRGSKFMTNSKVTLGIFFIIFFIASCSSVQKSSETITDEGVRGVSISSGERSTSEQAVLANATVYFEYDLLQLTLQVCRHEKKGNSLFQHLDYFLELRLMILLFHFQLF